MKKLSDLTLEELQDIAQHYELKGFAKMQREELIEHLSRILPEFADKKPPKKQDVVMKRTKRTIMYNIMFIACILISVFASLTILLEKFYFYPLILHIIPLSDIYGLILTLLSVVWSLYVYKQWIKTGVFHIYLLISTVLALGFFVYYCITDYHQIIALDLKNNLNFTIFRVYFYVKIGIMATLCLTTGAMFIWRQL